MSQRVTLLLAIAAGLAALVYWDQSRDAGPGATAARSAPSPGSGGGRNRATPATSALNPLAALSLEELRDTIARPLFEPSRRVPRAPPPPQVVKPEPVAPRPVERVAPDLSQFRLLGVVTNGRQAIALVSRSAGQQTVRVQEGDLLDGWRIERVEPAQILLSFGSQRASMKMFRDGR